MNPTAFEDVYRTHYAGLEAVARTYVGDPSVAEDVVQDVFLAVWRRRGELELRGNIRTYLHSAVRNGALDRLKHADGVRRHSKSAAIALNPTAEPADSTLLQRELASAIEAAVQQLPERAREAFIMSRDGGLSYAEISDVLGVSVKAVEASISRALRALRHQLAPFLEEDPARVS
jgi:RNA polymerase sigma-70 factor, ECF subfamily